MPRRLCAWAGMAAALLLSGCAQQAATEQGQKIHQLYGIIFVLAVLVFLLVEGVLIWSIVRFRKRDDTPPPQTVGSNRTLIGFFAFGAILVSVLFPFGERALSAVDRQDPFPQVSIRVEG